MLTNKNRPASTNRFRIVHEALFSINYGLLIRWVMAQANYVASELAIKAWINNLLHLHPHSAVGGNLAFLLLALGVALGIFLLLRVLSSTTLSSEFLRSVAGILSLIGLPAAWFYRAHLYRLTVIVSGPTRVLLWLELLITTICVVLFLYGKWFFPGWASVVPLVFHFSLWGWLLLGTPYFWLAPFQSLFPLAGFCSALAWFLYAASPRLGKSSQV